MFDAIADRYDLLNRIISLGVDQRWRAKAVAALALPERGHALDLATGTGDLAIAIADHHPEARVTGVDPSARMLEVGVKKLAARGLEGRVSMTLGEAESLPFEDASFDGVTIAFGIRNVADRPKGLREMRRVTRPGGRVVILELGEPEGGVMSVLARAHVHGIVPAVGGLLSGRREYAYLQASIAAFPKPDAFAAMMREAGLVDVSIERLTFGAANIFVGRSPAT
jgi:demethylmenaquinone methyltransferase/2-methoxy-6-polyprenyl-1,4-benzoquinol methylase